MNSDQIQLLVERYLADTLSDSEKANLTKWLDQDASHRSEFREILELEYSLDSHLGTGIPDLPNQVIQLKTASPSRSGFNKLERMGLAALVLLCLTLSWFVWKGSGPQNGQEAGSMAMLSSVSSDAIFSDSHELTQKPGDFLPKGWIRLEQGSIEIVFHSNASVELTGPAVFGIDTEMRGFLETGKVSVHVPEKASGFVIGTANAEFVDLGTRFQLNVDANAAAKVEVTEGRIEVHLGGDGSNRQIQSLPAGLKAKISETGELLSVTGTPLDPGSEEDFGLLAHWKLDDLGTDKTISDASGHNRHALFLGNPANASVLGKNGSAIDLSDSGSIDISDHLSTITKARSFTFSAWIKDANDIIFSLSDDSPRNRIQFERWGNLLVYGWQQGSQFDAVQAKVPNWEKDRWYHVAVIVSGREITLYRDGQHLISRSIGQRLSSKPLTPIDLKNLTHAHLGLLPSNQNLQAQRLGGQIDDVQIYGSTLDEEAIRYLFEHPGETYSFKNKVLSRDSKK